MKHQPEIITRYINGDLTAEERLAFENELQANAELKKEYDTYLALTKGAQRLGLKKQVSSSFKKTKTLKTVQKAAIGLGITLAVLGAVLLVKHLADKPASHIMHELNEAGNTNWAEADRQMESQVFVINTTRDTIIETQAGIVMSVPAGAFIHKNGSKVSGPIELEIKEAMTPLDIMKAGLTTLSDGKLLETGGMFYVNARIGEENLVIDKTKALNVNVPVNTNKRDMMLFKGERTESGDINWTEPAPMKKKLTTINITSLNFYPSRFLDTLQAMGFDIKNKKLTDSVYYSFITNCPITPASDTAKYSFDSVVASEGDETWRHFGEWGCNEINPARIKAIWNKQYNNTILATKEFEERLKIIFTTCNESILSLYVNNLNKNLYEIDSMAAARLSGNVKEKFLEFYQRKDGRVEISNERDKKLQAYFEEKRSTYIEAAAKTMRAMYEKEAKENQAAYEKQNEYFNSESTRSSAVFQQELEINMDEAYRQLGKKRPKALPANSYLSADLTQTGWNNVDRYVIESTVNRTTLDYTDPESGKKAIIKYQPITVTVTDFKNYDRVVCYMIPDKLSSFQNISGSHGKFEGKLNELMNYSVIAIGFKGSKTYYHEIKAAQAQQYTVDLVKISEVELKLKLQTITSFNQTADLLNDLKYQQFDIKENKRQATIAKREKIRSRLYPIVYPCYNYPAPAQQYDIEQ